MGRLGDRALHIEVEYRFGRTGRFFRQSAPAPFTCPGATIADIPVPHEIDIGVRLIGGPMPAEIVEKGWPIRLQSMAFEVAHWEREGVVNADDRRTSTIKLLL